MIEGFTLVWEGISNLVKAAVKQVTQLVNSIETALSTDPKIKKYLMISERTKKKRIKKKQLTKIKKRLVKLKER